MNEVLRFLLYLPRQSSTVAFMVDRLHYFVIGSTIGGAVLVTLIGAALVIRYRRTATSDPPRADANKAPPMWFENAAFGGLFVLFIVFWFIGNQQYSVLRVTPPGARTV